MISSFVSSVEDINVFFTQKTPITEAFLNNCFNDNSYCLAFDNIMWPPKEDVYGVCQNTSVPMTEIIKKEIEEDYGVDELQNREI